jgi:GH15 family glucan-1,4-alpha-glucosidase
MDDLYRRSIEIILGNQSPGGAYIASPNFPTYQYCWFRDGSFSAYAMDLAGEYESSRRFHQWAAERVIEREEVVRSTLQHAAAGAKLAESDILHTRYRLDGSDAEPGEWPNFQLDGFGTWLWALEQHARLAPELPLPGDMFRAVDLVSEYLEALWQRPCYDCWEEFPEQVHPYTLAAIYGGLQASERLTGKNHAPVTRAIRQQLLDNAQAHGHFVKFGGSPAVDASLLGLAVPYGVVAPEDPLMTRTVEKIRGALLRHGGLHRYAADTYYGGGAWVLLSAWLGWYYAELAKNGADPETKFQENILELKNWIAALAKGDSELPEQAPQDLNDPPFYSEWVERWGEIASPLLWSHAKYIILVKSLEERKQPGE